MRAPLLPHFLAMSPEKLGQHFLADESWQERIAEEVYMDDGPSGRDRERGNGEMTTPVMRRASKLFAVELDLRLARRVRKISASLKNVRVVESDVMAVDFEKLTGGARFSVYGNLPYHYLAHSASTVPARRARRGNSYRDSAGGRSNRRRT